MTPSFVKVYVNLTLPGKTWAEEFIFPADGCDWGEIVQLVEKEAKRRYNFVDEGVRYIKGMEMVR